MEERKPLTIVIFGATGNLYADKLARALFILFQEGKVPEDFKILAIARKDLSSNDFRAKTKEDILKKGGVDISKLEEFLSHVEYFKVDFSEQNDFVKLAQLLASHKDRSILFHIATAHSLYEQIFKNIKNVGLHNISLDTRILIEKPFGVNEADAVNLNKSLLEIFEEKKIFHVDHYLPKETAVNISDFKFKDGSIQKVKVIFHESNIVGSRGPSYDGVGAFRDVGENHMLELLALTIMEKPNIDMRISRAKALSDLYVDYDKPITKGQYEGYLEEPGVSPDSKTETFFRVFLKSKDPNFSDTSFELEGGKGLVDMHSDITTTTVAVEVYFKDGVQKVFEIQPVPGTSYDSYVRVYNDAIRLDQTLFVSFPEIISQWKLTDELLEKWQNVPLVIYKKGSKAEEIVTSL